MAYPFTISLIVARAINGVIGKNNALPWHIASDLKFFKAMTLGCPIIMGRNTYESLGRPLPKRQNIVVSRSERPSDLPDHVVWVNNLAQALEEVKIDTQNTDTALKPKVFIIGGAQLFKVAWEIADDLYLTVVNKAIEGDVYLDLDIKSWTKRVMSRPTVDEASGLEYWYEIWDNVHA
jgi:dihydrofolate reductase